MPILSLSSILFFRPRHHAGVLPDNDHLEFWQLEDRRQFIRAIHLYLKRKTGKGIPGCTFQECMAQWAETAAGFAHGHKPCFPSIVTLAQWFGRAPSTVNEHIIRATCLGLMHTYQRPLRPGGKRRESNVYRFPPVPRPNSPEWEPAVRRTAESYLLQRRTIAGHIERRLRTGREPKNRLRRYGIALGIAHKITCALVTKRQVEVPEPPPPARGAPPEPTYYGSSRPRSAGLRKAAVRSAQLKWARTEPLRQAQAAWATGPAPPLITRIETPKPGDLLALARARHQLAAVEANLRRQFGQLPPNYQRPPWAAE